MKKFFYMLKIEHANYFVLVNKRRRQLRPRLRVRLDITRVFFYVTYQDRLPLFRRRADDPFADRNVVLELDIFLKPQ